MKIKNRNKDENFLRQLFEAKEKVRKRVNKTLKMKNKTSRKKK